MKSFHEMLRRQLSDKTKSSIWETNKVHQSPHYPDGPAVAVDCVWSGTSSESSMKEVVEKRDRHAPADAESVQRNVSMQVCYYVWAEG